MIAALYTLYVINSMFLILVVLLQAGRGGGLAFAGGNTAGQVMGSAGGTTFLQKLTVASAAGFMIMSLLLAYLSSAPGSVDSGTFDDPTLEPGAAGGGQSAGGAGSGAVPSEGSSN